MSLTIGNLLLDGKCHVMGILNVTPDSFYDGGLHFDLADTQNSGSVGSYNWGGAASTFFWVDPREELICILMTQLMPSGDYPIRVQMQSMVYSAFID